MSTCRSLVLGAAVACVAVASASAQDSTRIAALRAVLEQVKTLERGPMLLHSATFDVSVPPNQRPAAVHDSTTLAALAPRVVRIVPPGAERVFDTVTVSLHSISRDSAGDYSIGASTNSTVQRVVNGRPCVRSGGMLLRYAVHCIGTACKAIEVRRVYGDSACR